MDKVKKKEKRGTFMGGYCHECQIKRGAREPKGGLGAVTVHGGECVDCGLVTTLVPSIDYDWPKTGQRAVWD